MDWPPSNTIQGGHGETAPTSAKPKKIKTVSVQTDGDILGIDLIANEKKSGTFPCDFSSETELIAKRLSDPPVTWPGNLQFMDLNIDRYVYNLQKNKTSKDKNPKKDGISVSSPDTCDLEKPEAGDQAMHYVDCFPVKESLRKEATVPRKSELMKTNESVPVKKHLKNKKLKGIRKFFAKHSCVRKN